MWIDVKIPYEPNRLVDAYNRSMRETTAPWVLLLDHDVFLALNPHWYDMSLEVINKVNYKNTGLITCTMNGCSDRPQAPDHPITKTPNLDEHVEIANCLYQKHGTSLKPITNYLVAGYFMLINRYIWSKLTFTVNGGKKYKLDQYYCQRLLKNRYKIYLMPGLYVYHRRGVRKLNWDKK